MIEELRQMVADKLAYMKDVNVRKATSFGMMLKPYLDAADDGKVSQEALERISNAIGNYETSNVVTI